MRVPRSRWWLSSIFLVAWLLVQPVTVDAQCGTSSVVTGSDTSFGMTYIYVAKYLSGSYMCTLQAAMNVIDCGPGLTIGAMGTGSTLSGTAFTTAVSPSCSWTCDCGTVTVTTADGLPVELMDFAIDDEVAAWNAGESAEEAGP